jgi:beta-glucosidase
MKTNVMRSLCALVVLALVPLAGAEDAKPSHSAVTPDHRNDSEWWAKRMEEKNARIAEGNVDLLFIGDSITHGWEGGAGKELWEEYYGDRNAANIGFSGDRTQHLLWRFEHGNLDGISPKVAVVMIGTNNHGDNTAEEIADGIKAVVQMLRDKLPETKVLLLGIFPRDEQPGTPNRQKLQQATDEAAKIADGDMIHFLDIGPYFLTEEGVLTKEVMPDALHPSKVGYQIWAESMEAKLAELLGELDPNEAPEGYTSIFNGEDLSGWEEVSNGKSSSWGAEDGLLYTSGMGGGWLSTTNEYDDFELRLEFRVPEEGNSGVFIRAPREGNPAFEGSEVQVLDDYAAKYNDLKPEQYTGSVYATGAPRIRVTRPAGAWQEMVIRADGPDIQVWVNGYAVTDVDCTDHEDKYADHPGLKREGGYIGLQNHGSRLDYRDIYIKEL